MVTRPTKWLQDPLNGYKTHQTRVCSPDSLNHSLVTQQKDGTAAVFYLFPCFCKVLHFFFTFNCLFNFQYLCILLRPNALTGGVESWDWFTAFREQLHLLHRKQTAKAKKHRIGFFQIGKSFGLQLQSQNQSNFYMLRYILEHNVFSF